MVAGSNRVSDKDKTKTSELVWKATDGSAIACTEKIDVLAQNLNELEQMALDALDDAVLMGVDSNQVRDVFSKTMKDLKTRFPNTGH